MILSRRRVSDEIEVSEHEETERSAGAGAGAGGICPRGMAAAPCDSGLDRGAVMRLRCDRRGRACGDVITAELTCVGLVGGRGTKM